MISRLLTNQRRISTPEPATGYSLAVLIASAMIPCAIATGAIVFEFSASPATWYLARASGLTLYLLLWFTAMLGLGQTTGLFDRFCPRGTIYSLHRFTTGLSYGFLLAHLLSLTIDAWVPFSALDLLVPFRASSGDPWTGAGVLAFYLFVTIGISSALIRKLDFRTWKTIHRLALPLYVLALAHGVGAGTDTAAWWARAIYLSTTSSLVCLSAYRLFRFGRRVDLRTEPGETPMDRLARPRTRNTMEMSRP